jgi:ectoine hydroxylase-related dioxygenase (phytanoyl-CoA dioxygenase family)
VEEIRIKGYTILPDVLDDHQRERFSKKLDSVYAIQAAEVGGEEALLRINDANVARCLLAYDSDFIEMAANTRVLDIVTRLMGDFIVLSQQNGVMNPPKARHHQTSWHRDLAHQHFVCSRPLSLSGLFCLDHFTVEMGGTYVLPGSHKIEKFPSAEYVGRHEHPVNAPAGAMILFDSMLFHRAGTNSSDHLRRGINHVYVLPFLKQQISLPRALGDRFSQDPFLRKFLGYASEPASNVLEWRKNRIAPHPAK